MTSTVRAAVVILAAAAAGVVLRAQESRPLPSQDALFKAVQENLIRAERVDYQYAFRERRTDIHTNPFGKLGTGGSTVADVYPSATAALTYRRVLERNGVALTPRGTGGAGPRIPATGSRGPAPAGDGGAGRETAPGS